MSSPSTLLRTTPDPTSDNIHERTEPMTTTMPITTPSPTTTTTSGSRISAPKEGVTFARIVSAEWLKFRTVRSNLVALVGAGAAAVGLGVLFSWLSGSGDGPSRIATDALSLSLGGFDLALMIVAILGVAVVAAEYQSGLIRSWFTATPSRVRVLAAKVAVYGTAVFITTGIAGTAAFLLGQSVLPDTMTALTLFDDGVMQALGGTALYGAAIAAMGIGLGFLLRSTAAGAGVVVSTLMIAPILVGLLPSSIGDPIGKLLPSNAAAAVTGIGGATTDLLSSGWGLVVLGAWVAATLGAAAFSLRRHDA